MRLILRSLHWRYVAILVNKLCANHIVFSPRKNNLLRSILASFTTNVSHGFATVIGWLAFTIMSHNKALKLICPVMLNCYLAYFIIPK